MILFWLLVCLPLVIIIGFGWRLARDERRMARERLGELLLVRLRESSMIVDDFFQRLDLRLRELTGVVDPHDSDSIRGLARDEPRIAQIFVLRGDDTLIYPDPEGPLNASERQFLSDYGDMILDNELHAGRSDPESDPAAGPGRWFVRYRGPGLQLLFGQPVSDDVFVGVLVQRPRWIADLIAVLPNTNVEPPGPNGTVDLTRIRLVDSDGRPVYEWGSFEPKTNAVPLQELALHSPLSSWKWQQFIDDEAFASVGRGPFFNLLSALASTALVLVGGGVWFFRQYHRNVREAMQRVSFVNQVSHELRTPLTNIRMYAELLEQNLTDEDNDATGPRRCVRVIVEESGRLSRLIGNVLTFGKDQRGQLVLRPQPAIVDAVIMTVVEHFRPALDRCGVEVRFRGSANASVMADVDAVEQILGNLLSNVEKYAVQGKRVEIASSQSKDRTLIDVRDFGPGIPARQRENVFKPFRRLSNHIAAAPGAGIGLTIARQLARLHGGDVVLIPSERGACFQIRLHTPSPAGDSAP